MGLLQSQQCLLAYIHVSARSRIKVGEVTQFPGVLLLFMLMRSLINNETEQITKQTKWEKSVQAK
jgi:hypothetical protein